MKEKGDIFRFYSRWDCKVKWGRRRGGVFAYTTTEFFSSFCTPFYLSETPPSPYSTNISLSSFRLPEVEKNNNKLMYSVVVSGRKKSESHVKGTYQKMALPSMEWNILGRVIGAYFCFSTRVPLKTLLGLKKLE